MVKSSYFLYPNQETITTTKTLDMFDASIQCLDPGDCDCHVVMPQADRTEGMFIKILNSSNGLGILHVYDETDTNLITTVSPKSQKEIINIGNVWSYYGDCCAATSTNWVDITDHFNIHTYGTMSGTSYVSDLPTGRLFLDWDVAMSNPAGTPSQVRFTFNDFTNLANNITLSWPQSNMSLDNIILTANTFEWITSWNNVGFRLYGTGAGKAYTVDKIEAYYN